MNGKKTVCAVQEYAAKPLMSGVMIRLSGLEACYLLTLSVSAGRLYWLSRGIVGTARWGAWSVQVVPPPCGSRTSVEPTSEPVPHPMPGLFEEEIKPAFGGQSIY